MTTPPTGLDGWDPANPTRPGLHSQAVAGGPPVTPDGDPFLAATGRSVPGARWVRVSDLLAEMSGRVAGWGIDLQASLARSARRLPAHTARVVSARARRLPPLSAFGGSRPAPAGPGSGLSVR